MADVCMVTGVGPKCKQFRLTGRVQWFIAAETVYTGIMRQARVNTWKANKGKTGRQVTNRQQVKIQVNPEQVKGKKQEEIRYKYKWLELKGMRPIATLTNWQRSLAGVYWLMREWGAGDEMGGEAQVRGMRWLQGRWQWQDVERKKKSQSASGGQVKNNTEGAQRGRMSRNVHNWGEHHDNSSCWDISIKNKNVHHVLAIEEKSLEYVIWQPCYLLRCFSLNQSGGPTYRLSDRHCHHKKMLHSSNTTHH